jgi:hypothetical protein
MRLRVHVEGGIAHFPGLNRPIELDSAMLPPEEAQEMQRLIKEARFFERPETQGEARGADLQRYTITVENGGRQRTIQVSDPVNDPHLEDLITYARKHRSS